MIGTVVLIGLAWCVVSVVAALVFCVAAARSDDPIYNLRRALTPDESGHSPDGAMRGQR